MRNQSVSQEEVKPAQQNQFKSNEKREVVLALQKLGMRLSVSFVTYKTCYGYSVRLRYSRVYGYPYNSFIYT